MYSSCVYYTVGESEWDSREKAIEYLTDLWDAMFVYLLINECAYEFVCASVCVYVKLKHLGCLCIF